MANFLLDSTVLIDYLRGREHVVRAVRELDREGHVLGVCAVNVTEVFSGALDQELARTEELLSWLVLWDITYADARQAGRIRQDLRRRRSVLSVPDALVAAVAISRNATVVTANVKDFDIPGVTVRPLASRS